MLCEWARGLPLPGGTLDCAGDVGALPLALVLAIAVVAVAAALMRERSQLVRALGAAVLLTGAAALFAFSADRPVRVASDLAQRGSGGKVVALIDLSDSVWRDEAAARAALDRLAARAETIATTIGEPGWTGQVLGFGAGLSQVGAVLPLDRLPDLVGATAPGPGGGGSRGTEALEGALETIRADRGRGVILLLSDGHFDTAVPDAILDRAAAAGIGVSVLATGSRVPQAGLISADLGPEQHVGQDAIVRATMLGGGVLSVSDGVSETSLTLPDRSDLQPVRLATRFVSRGLHHVTLRASSDMADQERVVYALVRGPARVLTFGDAQWLAGLDPARFRRVDGDPLDPPDPAGFDLVAIDGLSPDDFRPGFDAELLQASGRTGIFLVNGELRGAVDQPQVIGDWNETSLAPILPVDSDPREFIQDPPGRDIVILIDTSGSMDTSFPLATSVANAVIDQLRPQDTLAILPFSSISGSPFRRRNATATHVAAARSFLAGLTPDGGTAPDSTLRDAARLRTNYCAFFFISDGEFNPPTTSPQCFTTAISVVGRAFPAGVADWGQEIRLRGSVSGIRLEYFEPEVRDLYWRQDSFAALSVDGDHAPLGGLRLPGVAIAYPRVDADVLSLHPTPPPDPVLVMRRDAANPGAGTGVFLSEIPQSAPIADIDRILSDLLGWNRPDRFDVRLTQEGDRLTVTVLTLADPGAATALPVSLSGRLRLPGRGDQPLSFEPQGAPGRFKASVTLRLAAVRTRGELVLVEGGGQAQIIPVWLPAQSTTRNVSQGGEPFDFGLNAEELQRIRLRTGGADLMADTPTVGRSLPPARRDPIHAWAIVMGLAFFSASLWIRRRTN